MSSKSKQSPFTVGRRPGNHMAVSDFQTEARNACTLWEDPRKCLKPVHYMSGILPDLYFRDLSNLTKSRPGDLLGALLQKKGL